MKSTMRCYNEAVREGKKPGVELWDECRERARQAEVDARHGPLDLLKHKPDASGNLPRI